MTYSHTLKGEYPELNMVRQQTKKKKSEFDGKFYVIIGSMIIAGILSYLSGIYLYTPQFQQSNPFSGATEDFSKDIVRQPWQSSFMGNIMGNFGASIIGFFLILFEFPPLTIFLGCWILSYVGLKRLFLTKINGGKFFSSQP